MKKIALLLSILNVYFFSYAQNGWQSEGYTFVAGTHTASGIQWPAGKTVTIEPDAIVTFTNASYAGGNLVIKGELIINSSSFQLDGDLILAEGATLTVNGSFKTQKSVTYPHNSAIKITGTYEMNGWSNPAPVVTVDRAASFQVGKLALNPGQAGFIVSANTTVSATDVVTSGKLTVNGILNVANAIFSNGGNFTLNEGGTVNTTDFKFQNPNNSIKGIINASGSVEFHNKPNTMACPGAINTKNFYNYSEKNVIEGSGYIQVTGTFKSSNALTESPDITLNAADAGNGTNSNKNPGKATLGTSSSCAGTGNAARQGIESLPVTFGTISPRIVNNTLVINWSTLSETNNNHFDIEISNDGRSFIKIGQVKSAAVDGNSAVELNYEFTYTIPGKAIAGGLALMLLAGGSIMYKRKNRYHVMVMLSIILISATLFSCSKSDYAIETSNDQKVFVRIVQVDIDGQTSASQAVKATVK
ncbi:MAG: hypothetical protein QM594_15345 [Niabella sp.]